MVVGFQFFDEGSGVAGGVEIVFEGCSAVFN